MCGRIYDMVTHKVATRGRGSWRVKKLELLPCTFSLEDAAKVGLMLHDIRKLMTIGYLYQEGKHRDTYGFYIKYTVCKASDIRKKLEEKKNQ